MPYAQITLGQMVTELSLRLYDPGMSFWSQAELIQRIQDALRFWNFLTAQNQQWFSLSVTESGGPWYDLQTIAATPRTVTLEDADVYSRIQYHLLEEQLAEAGVLTSQFTPSMFVQATQGKRDEFLFRTSATRTVENLNVTPNISTLSLPDTVIQVERAYWLPNTGGTPYPLYRTDQFSRSAFGPLAGSSPSNPQVYSSGIEPPLTMELTPPPGFPGSVELVAVETQAPLSAATPTLLYLPGDCVPCIAWGAIADLLDSNAEASDSQRAAWARNRFEMCCEYIASYPFIMGARVNGIDTMVNSVEGLDTYLPSWRTPVATPPVVAFDGQNLICYPTTVSAEISLLINGNANIPAVVGDYVQIGAEAYDAILDLAQHESMFKMGFYELNATMPLLKNFLAIAAKKNDKVSALATYRDVMYSEMDSDQKTFAPLEVE
jgi:hypothetical protein